MPANSHRLAAFMALLLLMTATRFTHAGGTLALPDASWAVFFLGGFYLSREWRWALPALIVAAVGVDVLAIGHYDLSNYCATVAYWFIVPGDAALWLGGAWLRQGYRRSMVDVARLLVSLVASVTVCFAITHSAFYWLGGRIAHRNLQEWWSVFMQWFPYFLGVTALYVAVGALVHLVLTDRKPVQTLPARRDVHT
jgi:hypothetical protein